MTRKSFLSLITITKTLKKNSKIFKNYLGTVWNNPLKIYELNLIEKRCVNVRLPPEKSEQLKTEANVATLANIV